MNRARRACIGLVVIVGIALLLFFPTHPLRADSPSSLEEYRNAIAQALTLIQQANALPSNERAATLKQAADILTAIHIVQLSSGAQVMLDNSALVVLIQDSSKTDDAIARLTALRDAMAIPPAAINAADLDALRDILNYPPFVTDTSRNWLAQLIDAIIDFLNRLVNNTAQGIYDTRDLFVLAGVILVVIVLVYFARALRRNVVSEEILAPLKPDEEARTPAEALSLAQQFANAGDYRSAVRQMYLATLLLLDQRGKLKYDPTLTNREYLREATLDPRTSSALAPIIDTFDRTWYGFEPISREEFEAYRQHVEGVKNL
ncbi:MAG TPA: DUF4129 domain-containing protein [Anaerolineae bacterium]|nr:DUF4129 domain-containing protein [Anaerolineae bacterium]